MRADERIGLLRIAESHDVDEGVEIPGEGLQRPGGAGTRLRQPVEPFQNLHCQPVVEMVALAAELAVADDGIDLAIDGAFHELVRNGGQGGQ